MCTHQKNQLVFIDQMELIESIASQYEISLWIKAMAHVMETKKRLRYNMNPQLALEQLFVQLQGG